MRLIDTTYFGSGLETELMNITTATGDASAKDKLESFIGLKEVAYLESMFGYSLAKVIIDAYDASISVSPPPTPLPDRVDWIINGQEFTDWMGRTQKWKGLQRDDKTSPVADYVYYYWRQMLFSTITTEGYDVQPEIESSKVISPVDKVVFNWNHGVKENRILWDFMRANASEYPEYDGFQYADPQSKNLLNPINSLGL